MTNIDVIVAVSIPSILIIEVVLVTYFNIRYVNKTYKDYPQKLEKVYVKHGKEWVCVWDKNDFKEG